MRRYTLELCSSFLIDYIKDPNRFRTRPGFDEIDVISPEKFAEHDLNNMDTIGKGGFGEIKKNISKDGLTEYALKRLQTKRISKSKNDKFVNEFRLIQSLEHPNIIKCHGIAKLSKTTFIVLELCKTDLKSYIKQTRKDLLKDNDFLTLNHEKASSVEYEQRLRLLVGIVEGVRYMHARDIIHLDIKPHNILVTKSGVARLTDFGLSQFIGTSSQVRSYGFTPHYSAPE